ncbi:hypothetical protein NQ317_007351 [Molorchus minor]|uniref:Uncharacterized protein n=1 Tax=Molorchus minor TaxID=1323400 RepID=A0ABQ9J4E3_9CUCU|nr:hypothetical protein NQ317_007351 [Molorchus minor]
MGFGKRGKTSFTVHRSEEILPGDVRLSKQGSSASSDGEGSADGDRTSIDSDVIKHEFSENGKEYKNFTTENLLKNRLSL